MPAAVMVVAEDLFFLAKIREAAKAVGVAVVTGDVRNGTAVAAQTQPLAIFLDLNLRGLSALDCVRALKADPATQAIRIVGYVSHVQKQMIADARAAGCDSVLARSAFANQLPSLLQSLVGEGR
jgi:CheY-like chemotaxis protein